MQIIYRFFPEILTDNDENYFSLLRASVESVDEYASLEVSRMTKSYNFRLIPSYKRMCITILKNDTSCQYMGFGQTKDELQKKKEAMKKWETFL